MSQIRCSRIRNFLRGNILAVASAIALSAIGICRAETTLYAPKTFPPCPVTHITDAIITEEGAIWVVGENESIYRLDVDAEGKGSWFNMKYYKDYPNCSDFRCLAQDKQGRVWVGTDHAGVAVFNGESWASYDRSTTLPGDHIFDISVSPLSGEVAIATSGGITIYNPAEKSWRDLTRADGLISDQVQSLSFSRDGTLWLAYPCGGIAQSSPQQGYRNWKTTQTKWYWDNKQYVRQPAKASGKGLPSNACNTVFVTRDQHIAVGTCSGLGYSFDRDNWQFVRGADYQAKNAGVYGAKASAEQKKNISTLSVLSEDYITTLAESDKGLLVGFRSKGAALINTKNLRVSKQYGNDPGNPLPSSYMTALIPTPDGSIYGGTYGGGFVLLEKGKGQWKQQDAPQAENPPFPEGRKLLTEEQIAELIKSQKTEIPSTEAPIIFWKEDWNTLGNWCGRYGADYALLCASNAPYGNDCFESNHAFGIPPKTQIAGRIGCNRQESDSLRHWVDSLDNPNNNNVLFNLQTCNRIEAEWDDHGEAYRRTFDGPDVWIAVDVPKGLHAVSLYFFNPNGKRKEESMRDFVIEVRKFKSSLPEDITFKQSLISDTDKVKKYCREEETSKILQQPVLARTRVKDFSSHGVYKTFLAQEEGTYYFRVSKNYSFNTIINGVFVDLLYHEDGRPYTREQVDLDYGNLPLEAPHIKQEKLSQSLLDLWNQLNVPVTHVSELPKNELMKLDLYRLACARPDGKELLANWRWFLKLWSKNDYDKFEEDMLQIWYHKQDLRKGPFCSSLVFKRSPRTIPFSVKEISLMGYMNIDWKQYLPTYPGTPTPTAEEFHKIAHDMSEEDFLRLQEKKRKEAIEYMKKNKLIK